MNRVVQVKVRGYGGQVIGVVVHVVAVGDLRRASVTAAVVGDDPVTVQQEVHQLGVPVVTGQRPAVTEDDRLPRSPVLVEDFRAVAGRDRRHPEPPVKSGCSKYSADPHHVPGAIAYRGMGGFYRAVADGPDASTD